MKYITTYKGTRICEEPLKVIETPDLYIRKMHFEQFYKYLKKHKFRIHYKNYHDYYHCDITTKGLIIDHYKGKTIHYNVFKNLYKYKTPDDAIRHYHPNIKDTTVRLYTNKYLKYIISNKDPFQKPTKTKYNFQNKTIERI